MNHLFYREKETWWQWLIWGVFGALLTYYIATFTQTEEYIFASLIIIIGLLTWRMQSAKRFGFLRAFKISFFVFSFSSLPLLLTKPIKLIILGDVDLSFGLILAASAGIIVSLISSFIAKSPRQYY
ncbi:hypothetical protein [Pseudoalteromonas denitrificans]|uniref:Uncharacterized protein n=1 Tax=Pseudoalteromonas denitrificans DSM 6059 TaxID=1123010 RepID=A0A1I1NSR4_9GAMM|nr:hypothetical protein [Pseudoalteromonas denitrificans]SFD00704.1 hypothetical protein SAMN02745724_03175 [Pseudoalteromonas denitrificans DSM 6059]